ncbi:hypothetical protein [uncultured Maribacter sp.]|uniref:hypothetical protein n=1 Tax=uncultured Maribacter sp. TaxID=431308 RepID=UPI00262C602F|nr:hypothetical protein [uncultured Maribacter sp.]
MNTIYTDYKSDPSKYSIHQDYRIALSRNFITLVVTTFIGNNEMESRLINYDLDGNLIANLKISYDKIGKDKSKRTSSLKGNIITIIDSTYHDSVSKISSTYQIMQDGKIIKTTDEY